MVVPDGESRRKACALHCLMLGTLNLADSCLSYWAQTLVSSSDMHRAGFRHDTAVVFCGTPRESTSRTLCTKLGRGGGG